VSRKGGELVATSCAGWYVVLVAVTAAPLDVHLESRARRQELGDDAALPLNQSGSPVITAAERRRRRAAEEVRAAARAEARQKAVDEAKAKAARDMDLLRQERKAAQLKARKVAKKERKRRVKDQAASTGAMSSDGASVKSRGSPTRRMKVCCACFAMCAVAVPYWDLPRVLHNPQGGRSSRLSRQGSGDSLPQVHVITATTALAATTAAESVGAAGVEGDSDPDMDKPTPKQADMARQQDARLRHAEEDENRKARILR